MLAYDYPILGVFWTLLLFFLFAAWIFIVIWVFVDNFRRSDHSGWSAMDDLHPLRSGPRCVGIPHRPTERGPSRIGPTASLSHLCRRRRLTAARWKDPCPHARERASPTAKGATTLHTATRST